MIKQMVIKPVVSLFGQWAFVTAFVFMALCAGGLHWGMATLQYHTRKLPLPLKAPLDTLDVDKLPGYVLVNAAVIPEEIEAELGTKDYIQWTLEDRTVASDAPGRYVNVFVTYYTGNPDKVPHVPDWCYVGGGGEVDQSNNTTIPLDFLDGDPEQASSDDELPVRVLVISLPGYVQRSDKVVLYFFSVNGDYACTRDAVRVRQMRLTDRYAYFSKVELSFSGTGGAADIDQTLVAAEKFLKSFLPVLLADHWPDWAAAVDAGPSED